MQKWLKMLPLAAIALIYTVLSGTGVNGLSPEGLSVIFIFLSVIYLWATEMIPLPVTAFMGMMLLALSGSVSMADSIYGFGNTVVFLIIVGFFLSAGLTKTGLDKRIAFAVLRHSHSENALLAGTIMISAFLSMIISNTTAILLMIPIVMHMADRVAINRKALLLGAAFAANIGGAGILIGTPPNIIGAQALGWGFYEWMVAAMPLTLVMLLLLYVSMLVCFRPDHRNISRVIRKPDKWSTGEKKAAVIISLTVLLWILSPVHGLPAVVVGLAGGVLMMVFLYEWKYFEKHTHWGTIILIAGAVSLGRALEITGAAGWMAETFLMATGFSSPLMAVFGLVVLSLAITQFIQNTATAAMMIPVASGIAASMGLPAEAFVVPLALGVSMTFLMPPGTAPNAIVHSMGRVSARDMFRAGILPTCFALIALLLYSSVILGGII